MYEYIKARRIYLMEYALYRPTDIETRIVHVPSRILPRVESFKDDKFTSKIQRIQMLTFHNFTNMAFVDIHGELDESRIASIFDNNFDYVCVWFTGAIIKNSTIDNDIIDFMSDKSTNVLVPSTCKIYKKGISFFNFKQFQFTQTILSKIDHIHSENEEPFQRLSSMRYTKVFAGNNEQCVRMSRSAHFDGNAIDTFILPCSGLNQFAYISMHLDSVKKIIFYDVNTHSIEWFKYIVENWNGNDSMRIVADNFNAQYSQKFEFLFYDDIEDQYFRNYKHISPDTISKIRECEIHYIHCDITNDSSDIINLVNVGDNVFINTSNIWHYESNFLANDGLSVDYSFFKLTYELRQRANIFYFRGQSPSCRTISISNVDKIKGFL